MALIAKIQYSLGAPKRPPRPYENGASTSSWPSLGMSICQQLEIENGITHCQNGIV
jgi:hypothetical protein